MRSIRITPLLIGLTLAGCGGDPVEPAEPAPSSSAGAEVAQNPDPVPVAAPAPETAWTPHDVDAGDPNLTVRVEGPEAASEPTVGAVPFTARLQVTNSGTEAAEIQRAHVAFDVWREDGARFACTRQGDAGEAPLIEPEETHTLTATAICNLPEPGEYEVRTYVSFDAESTDGDLARERYYAARQTVHVN